MVHHLDSDVKKLSTHKRVSWAEGTREPERSNLAITISGHKHIKDAKYIIYSIEVFNKII
jgi:hypothetical protein